MQGALSLLGRLYYEQGDYKQALHYELMALKIATNSSDDNVRLICQINNNIGYTYFKLNENQKALQYFLQSLKIAEQEKDNATVYLLAANVADAYLKLNAPSEAVKFFQHITKKYAIPAELKYEGGDYGISQTYLKIYMALKQYDKARLYCDELIRQTTNPNINLYPLSLYYELIAKYYIETADYEIAQYYLKKDKDLVGSLKNLSGIAQNYNLWFSLDTASGKYKEAIGDLIKANAVKDSIFDETKSRQIAQLDVEFETEKKEGQINLLNQKAILESTKLKQADFVKNVTVAGVILLLIIAGLLYKQSHLRKKSNVLVTHKNQQLQSLLTEKEWLLKEVHHRVKNNLHTVICLLESQARYLEEDALRAIESSQNRIFAMSLIHQKLYQSDDIGTIDIDNYLRELTNYLSDSFGSPANISIQLQLEKVKLNLSQAIPLGLIVNEAITNSFKYAFPNKCAGKITIELKQTDNHIRLIIADNGIGMRLAGNDNLPKSLGLDLMRGLTSELQGRIRIENDKGTRINLFFPMEHLNSSPETDTHSFHIVNSHDI
jgi:two-component sensor histidine kinase